MSALACSTLSFAQEAEETPDCIHGIGSTISGGACITSNDLLGLLDLNVPENSLFTLMNATPDTVIRPKVGDKFTLSILPQLQNAFGSENYAIGIEVNPGLLMAPSSFTMSEFSGRADDSSDASRRRVHQIAQSRLFSRFTISAAASRTAADDSDTQQYGLGLNYNYDSGSPFHLGAQTAYGQCIDRRFTLSPAREINRALSIASRQLAAQRLGIEVNDANFVQIDNEVARLLNAEPSFVQQVDALKNNLLANDPSFAVYRTQGRNAIEECAETAAPWNRLVYGAGVAAYYSDVSSDDDALDGTDTGFGAWATYAHPVGDRGQAVLSARYLNNAIRTRTSGDDEVTEAYDGWMVGGRYIHSFTGEASERAWRGFVEVAYSREEFGGVEDEFTQAGIGFEVQLQDNVFFQAMVGDTFGSEIERDSYLSGQIKWSFSQARAE